MNSSKPLSECHLYAFVDTAFLRGRAPEAIARQLCDGGADLIQLRAKQSSPEEVRRMAEAILPVVRSAGVGLVINDHLAIAQEIGADFCHLGQEDFFGGRQGQGSIADTLGAAAGGTLARPAVAVPKRVPVQLGLSTHSPEDAKRALAAGPAYLGVGPVYATGTKPDAEPATLNYVRWAAEHVSIPWFAIGGVNLTTLDEVLGAGGRRICVVSAILNASDVAAACRQFKARL